MVTESQARDNLKKLLDDFNQLTADERKAMSEASVVRQFIDRLLEEVLGWPIKDPLRYKYEMVTQAGRPDLTLFPEKGGVIFVEAKRFGVIKELEQARFTIQGVITPGQMALPGMAVDRTPEEQQAINYAFANNGSWAILTNFERLRLFNARRDWLVLSFERPGAYLTEFDQLWQLSYENVINGSLDALSNQRYARDIDSEYLAFVNEWREKLAQDVVKLPDKNPWAFNTDGTIKLVELRSVVQRFLDRLVVARFAEDWLVIPPGTLRQIYELRQTNRYTFSLDQQLDQFFRRFDEEHNSALFAYGLVDEAHFSDDVLMPLMNKLYEVRYRAMPADILGNTYEQYLGKALALSNGSVTTRDNLETRKKQGSYYTPQVIVQYIVDHSLGRYLYGTENGKPDGQPIPGETRKTSADIRDLKVLDSACGSGSFLINAYQTLARFYESEQERLKTDYDARVRDMAANFEKISLDDRIAAERIQQEQARIRDYARLILEGHLYGVDLDPQAAEIATVNLIMRAMEGRHHERLLPLILNQNVKVGNGLVGLRADDPRLADHRDQLAALRRLRAELVQSPKGEVHDTTLRDVEKASDQLRAELDEQLKAHFTDLARVRPFHWGVEFPEVFYNEDGTLKDNPGFTIVFGNPPWEIVQPDLREFYSQFDANIESKLNRLQVETRITELAAEDPRRQTEFETQNRLIEETSSYLHQSQDYMYQGKGKSATHKLFLERMYSMLQSHGRVGYVVPSGLYLELGSKDLREMLLTKGNIQYIFSFSNERFFFPGVHHSFKFVLLGAQKGAQSDGFWATFRFNPRVAVAPDDLHTFLENPDNLIYVRQESLKRFSPNSLSMMELQTRQDYEIVEKLYSDWTLLGEKTADKWQIGFSQELNATSDRDIFNTQRRGLPLYEGKMFHQFNAFYAEPQYWVEEYLGAERLKNKTGLGYKNPRLVFRDIARSTDERTLISAIIPPNSFCNNKAPVAKFENSPSDSVLFYICGLFNSFVLDYVIRQKISVSLNFFYMETLPLPRLTAGNPTFDAIVERAARLTCTRPEFADLWKSVMGTDWTPLSTKWGGYVPAVRASEESREAGGGDNDRSALRNEIDALVAHLYGLTRDEFDHILTTFPLVFPDTDEGRAKRAALLATYDSLRPS